MFSDKKKPVFSASKALMTTLIDGVKYARDAIVECSTALANHSLPPNEIIRIKKNVAKVHSKAKIEAAREFMAGAYMGILIDESKKNKAGNCREYALLLLAYLAEQKFSGSAELFNINNGNHVFVVINRKKGSIESDPTTWGDEVIICDPWADIICSRLEMMDKIKNLTTNSQDYYELEKLTPQHTLQAMPGFTLDALKNWHHYQQETGDYRALFAALKEGEENEFIAQLKTNPPKNINLLANDGLSLLHVACQAAEIDMLEAILAIENVNVNLEELHNAMTPLHLAVLNKRPAVIPYLIDKKANVNAQDNTLATPLHLATQQQCFEIVEFLLKSGANPYIKNSKGQTCFDIAMELDEFSKDKILKMLQSSQSQVKTFEDKSPTVDTLFKPARVLVDREKEVEQEDVADESVLAGQLSDGEMTVKGYALYD